MSDQLALLWREKCLTCPSAGLSSLACMSQDDPDGVLPRRRRERKPRQDPFFQTWRGFSQLQGSALSTVIRKLNALR
jgi:hypothetical protein